MKNKTPPIYDIKKSYLENLENGPFYHEPIPPRLLPERKNWIDFLGFPVASPIGVPAGPLLDSKWIDLAANLGFDILTYKTIRSHEHPSHPLPNIMPVKTDGQLLPRHLPDCVYETDQVIDLSNDNMGITNSFGNPSKASTFLEHDIPLANAKLRKGQVMIVSVFGTSKPGVDVIDDFVDTALFAKHCGAQIIEANYSCPNVAANEGSLYASPESVYSFSSRIVKALGETPLIIKVGVFPDTNRMRETFIAAARAGVRAICGINTISIKVLNQKGEPALGPDRLTCGICGNPIRQAALDFIQQARDIIEKEKLDLVLLSTGGATQPTHFQQFLNVGADIAMTATGMMWDPYLAMKFHESTTSQPRP